MYVATAGYYFNDSGLADCSVVLRLSGLFAKVLMIGLPVRNGTSIAAMDPLPQSQINLSDEAVDPEANVIH